MTVSSDYIHPMWNAVIGGNSVMLAVIIDLLSEAR